MRLQLKLLTKGSMEVYYILTFYPNILVGAIVSELQTLDWQVLLEL